MCTAATKLSATLNFSQADFVDFKKTHSIEGTWGVPLKVIRPFLYHLAGFGLKFVRALVLGHGLELVEVANKLGDCAVVRWCWEKDDQRVAVEVVSPSLLIQKLVMSLGMIDLILGMKDLILGVTTNKKRHMARNIRHESACASHGVLVEVRQMEVVAAMVLERKAHDSLQRQENILKLHDIEDVVCCQSG
ncbi:hypothetical protein H257_08151 [Aphanomyces astaci]|uniref:Uncharacterized protein n=1 Tax=Aphanomyces astaci TaxID=112090 RepID=W4GFQ5_APHAT|nr:hypothetical protein H257_08151 [Aphanomyces astaci]ETV77904.1 hypothetical protein H257_08151 [Aphanomyces astaci]|eukprot:XP_009832241.1 hypothetical protein H257_08151 [Aphanomyces astaci]